MKKNIPLAFIFILLVAKGTAQIISSPDKQLQFRFSVKSGIPQYDILYKQRPLISHSSLALTFAGGDVFGKNIRAGRFNITDEVEEYEMPVGKASYVRDVYKQAVIPLQEKSGKERKVNLHIKIFNDGVAFRYEFPYQPSWNEYVLTEENTSFNITGNPTARVAFLPNLTTAHEHRYTVVPMNEIPDGSLMDMPALFSFEDKTFMAITEAALVNYAGMSLIKQNGKLSSQLTPLPGQQLVKVKAVLPHKTPWRVLMISDRVGALVESNMLTSLNEPCATQDLSWLKPGKASFHWWSGDVLPDTTFEAGNNFNFNKYYIDFCAANNIEYHTIIGNRGVAWYKNDGAEYQPGPNTDITQPQPGLDIAKLCEYAKSKGVGIRFWTHWRALYPKLDTALALFEKWGVSGMMVDFMDRDDQEMIQIQEEILQKAMKHHLEIQFHGVAKPTGLNRTYPNESTREGTLNYENNKWGNLVTPDDDIQIPFTRLLAGPTDYHLGGFRAMPAAGFKVQFTKPHMLATRCHMLAMYVVLENSLSMVCDYPQAYEAQPGFEFLQEVPTTWDQTVVPGAEAGKWITIARRKGANWFLGTINNSEKRTITLPLDFLAAGNYEAEIYNDGPEAMSNPNQLTKIKQTVTPGGKLTVELVPGGGQVIKLTKFK